MTPQTAAEALLGLGAGVGVVLFWRGPIRWVAIDWARERMFAARERLYDAASADEVCFQDERYKRIRERVNDNIRFAHAGSLPLFLAHEFFGSISSSPRSLLELRRMADSFSTRTIREAAHYALDESEFAIATLLFVKSPVVWIFAALRIAVRHSGSSMQHRGADGIWKTLSRALADEIQADIPVTAKARS